MNTFTMNNNNGEPWSRARTSLTCTSFQRPLDLCAVMSGLRKS